MTEGFPATFNNTMLVHPTWLTLLKRGRNRLSSYRIYLRMSRAVIGLKPAWQLIKP